MHKDDLTYVGHMLDTARKVVDRVGGLSRETFDQDENLRLALTHLIQVIGEAAARVSEEFCRSHPEVPWKAIVGMRHKVVHNYLNVDEDVVWDTASREILPLTRELERILAESGGD
jgi:uncharacterized protein with HEPN domain